jgi:uncharacterized protein (TIGR03435 family)
MSKPLHKDLSFWIVVVTLVGAADVAQLYFGLPWFKDKIVAAQPAPRTENPAQVVDAFNQPANLDVSKKTFPWQAPRFNPRLLQDAAPQVVIIPTEYTAPSGGWGTIQSNAAIGVRMSADYVVQSAYNWPSRARMILPDQMPPGQFDFIAKQPDGALEALQAEIKNKLGLVAEREMVQTNVLILRLDHTNAPGLTPSLRPVAQTQSRPGTVLPYRYSFRRIGILVTILESQFRLPVIDQTGLTGTYDIQFPMISRATNLPSDPLEQEKKIFIEQLGLELVESNASVEMLVVKKIN